MINPDEARRRIVWGIIYPGIGVALLWMAHAVNVGLDANWYRWGIYPRSPDGLPGIIFSPFLHGDYGHLASNSTALFVLGFVMINIYPRSVLRSLFVIWLLGGTILWLIGRENYHIGASGLVYGIASYLFTIGLLRWEPRAMAVALFVVFLYGSLWWGLLPIVPEMSWEGHVGGAIAGMVAAALFFKREPLERDRELQDDDTDLPYWMYEEEGELKNRWTGSPDRPGDTP